MKTVTEFLLLHRDEKYADFSSKLVPNIDKDTIIGVRLPDLRSFAKSLIKTGDYICFLSELPHTYHEENLLHVCVLSALKNYEEVIRYTEEFLPYIDNWAVCDSFNPKCFKNHKTELYRKIYNWIKSEHIYTRRFAVDMLMGHFLGDSFLPENLSLVISAQGDDYYINMAVAWYFATALAKQYDETVKIIEAKKLDKWVHNKTIQKAVESYRINDETKAYLKTLKIK